VIELEDSVQWLTNATYPPESEVCDSEGSLVVFGFYLPYYFSWCSRRKLLADR
jgi:hypothetical protein